jgi:unsaturated rhamnogalacturonyl hydrolase
MEFKKALTACIFFILLPSMTGCGSTRKSEPWSVRMAESEMIRFPESWMLDFSTRPRWAYCQGLVCKAMLDLWEFAGDRTYFDYALSYADTMITEEGVIRTYDARSYNIDNINAGKILFTLYSETGEEKFKKAIDTLRGQMRTHPRTTEGGFWHKLRYPHQMWLDGIYMGSPFLAQYALEFNEPALFDDVVNQIKTMATHSYDPETGLFYHGWDESREQQWANKETGQSPNFWGRSLGWFAMALVDVLDYLPEDHQGRGEVMDVIDLVAKGIAKYQDESSGVWYQVIDQGDREGNYLEATASCMFVYFLYKAVRKGYIDKSFLSVADKGYEGILKNFIREDPDGTISLTSCCSVAGLGGSPRYRDGSFEYYISEPVRDNDPKGTGPFIMASIERERLKSGS